MEIKGATFLYTLATLSITFAGFAALFTVLRQTAGGKLNALDRFLTRTVFGHLFIILAAALLPPALALFEVPETWIWRSSTVAFALPMLPLLATYHHRRVAATGKRAPLAITVLFQILYPLSILAMLGCVFFAPRYAAAAYVAGLTFNFLSYGFAFLIAIEVLLRDSEV
jgi:hypothetical protein